MFTKTLQNMCVIITLSLGFWSGAAIGAGMATGVSTEHAEIRKMIENQDHAKAIEILRELIESDPDNAEHYNLLGYASRGINDYAEASSNYAKALELDPNHKGALEYQGELYLLLNRPARAKANLEALRAICGEICEEYQDLAEEIVKYTSEK